MRICENCGEKPANIHIRQIINNQESEHYICNNCAEKMQKSFLSFLKMNAFITGMMKDVKPEENGKVCPMCKFDMKKIQKLGRVGCAMCYEVFEKELEPILSKINIRNSFIQKDENNNLKEINKLKIELNKAVVKEEYEKAAAIRDKISLLKGEAYDNMAKQRT